LSELLSSLLPGAHSLQLASILAQFALILVAVKLAGHLSQKAGQPSVFGKLLVGLVLGPAVLGILHPTPLIKELSEVGVILLMFLAGLETNLKDLRKSALASGLVAVCGVVLPFLGGWGVSSTYGYDTATAIFVGVLLVATSVSISVQTLRELGRLNSKEGVTILGAAVIDDVLGLIVLSTVLGLLAAEGGAGGGLLPVLLLAVKVVVFFGLAAFLGMKVVPPITRWFSKFKVGAPLIAASVAVALAFAALAELFGLAGIVGAYVCGLALSVTDLKERMFHEVEVVTFSTFTSFFFVSVGLAADIRGLGGKFWVFVILLTFVAIMTKILGGGLGARLAGMRPASALAVGVGMIARGEVGLIVAGIGLERGLITQEIFTGMVVMVMATTIVTPPLLKAVFNPRLLGKPTATDDE
jgi:Kef-type K+ transport system membrane component KefB